MNFKNVNLNFFLLKIILISSIISYSIILCFNNNFGWDHDSYAILNSFKDYIENNNYRPSRKPGYPVSDLIIGSISYYFGSKIINLFVFISAIIASLIFFVTFKNNLKEFALFFILLFSNSTILSNITIPIDYPITLLFYFSGIFYLKNNKNFFLLCLFFSLCIGSRPNFIIFVLPVLIYYGKSYGLKFLIKSFIMIGILSLAFFIPVLNYYNFNLIEILKVNTTQAVSIGNNKLNFILGQFIRTSYKYTQIFSIFNLILFTYIFITNFYKIYKNDFLILLLALINYFLFFLIPDEYGYVFLLIFIFYFIIFKYSSKIIIYIVILINFLNFFYILSYPKIIYKKNECNYERIGVIHSPTINYGFFFNVKELRTFAYCYEKKN